METTVFYKHRTPLFIQVNGADVDFFSDNAGLKTLKIYPGPNKIDKGLWEHIKQKPAVKKRVHHGRLRESGPTKALLMDLRGPVDRSSIGLLCSKAREVPDGEVFEAKRATSPEGAIREIEDQVKELRSGMPTVTG